jgi:glycine hydroxymethyltransferase
LGAEDKIKAVNSMIFPGIQGGPLMHVIAAKAVAFGEALEPEFKTYQKQVVTNAKTLATALTEKGFPLVTGGTDNHLMLVDVTVKGTTGKDASAALDHARITVNKNTIPFDKNSPFVTSGIRLGTPAVTTRGMKQDDMKLIAGWIAKVLSAPQDAGVIEQVKKEVEQLVSKHPLYPELCPKAKAMAA